MKIWLLNSRAGKENYSMKRMYEEWKKQWLNIKKVYIDDIELVINQNGEEQLFVKNKAVKLPDVVVPRNNTSYLMRSITDYLEKAGVNIVNNTIARALAKDKFLSLQKLAFDKLPVPKTILLKWIPNIDFIESQLSYPIIVKKIEGAQWKGILKVNNRHELEDIMEMLQDTIEKLNLNLILQEFIGEKSGQDLRVFTVGGKVIACMLRKWKDWDFKANYSGGWSTQNHEINEIEEMLGIQASLSIWLDIAGVDLLFDKNNGYKICEVNANPGFEWLEEATGKNIAWEIISYIKLRYIDAKIN